VESLEAVKLTAVNRQVLAHIHASHGGIVGGIFAGFAREGNVDDGTELMGRDVVLSGQRALGTRLAQSAYRAAWRAIV